MDRESAAEAQALKHRKACLRGKERRKAHKAHHAGHRRRGWRHYKERYV